MTQLLVKRGPASAHIKLSLIISLNSSLIDTSFVLGAALLFTSETKHVIISTSRTAQSVCVCSSKSTKMVEHTAKPGHLKLPTNVYHGTSHLVSLTKTGCSRKTAKVSCTITLHPWVTESRDFHQNVQKLIGNTKKDTYKTPQLNIFFVSNLAKWTTKKLQYRWCC